MPQQIKAAAITPSNLHAGPGIHLMEGAVLQLPHSCAMPAHSCEHTGAHTYKISKMSCSSFFEYHFIKQFSRHHKYT